MRSILYTAVVPALLTTANAVPSYGKPPGYGSGSANVSAVNTTNCNGATYVYEEMAGYGFIPSDARDRFGDTIGTQA
jgi:hypothetical protein